MNQAEPQQGKEQKTETHTKAGKAMTQAGQKEWWGQAGNQAERQAGAPIRQEKRRIR